MRPTARVLVLLALLGLSVPASADDVDAAVAAARGSSLPIGSAAEQTAQSSASSQASAGSIFHASLGHLTSTCAAAAEIVGRGSNISTIFSAFRQSPSHWSKLSDPTWTAMGTGLAAGSDGNLYVSVVFCRQDGAAPAPPPTSSTGTPRPAGRSSGASPAPPAAPPPPPPIPVDVDRAPTDFSPPTEWEHIWAPSIA